MTRIQDRLPTVALAALLFASVAVASGVDAPEISRSRGNPESIVVLWPRIIPADNSPDAQWRARMVQQELASLVREALPGRSLDIRPAPERVCPMGGCNGLAVGALVMRDQEGCAVVALISRPGTNPTEIYPWVGDVRLRATRAPFREPPENWVTVTDFGRCDQLPGSLEANAASIRRGIQELGR